MDQSLLKIKNWIIDEASNPKFMHHQWFVQFHLEIFEKIALELCDAYSNADRDLIVAITWLHDLPKIKNKKNIDDVSDELYSKLIEFGCANDFIDKVVEYIKLQDSYKQVDIRNTPIEVQICSSSDGASHLIGPFFSIYWFENPNKKINEILESNLLKLKKDWELKIVLPEVKNIFKGRFNFLLEQNGQINKKIFR